MAFVLQDSDRFVHIVYRKELFGDIEGIRRELQNHLMKLPADKQVILDYENMTRISSLEIGFITMTIAAIAQANRPLRVIADPQIVKILELTGVALAPGLRIFTEREKAFA